MEFNLINREVPNGTVLLVGITYPGMEPDLDATRGRAEPKVFTYAMLKAGGLWFVTGSGKVPMAAGWEAVRRWLMRDNRHVEWVDVVTGQRRVWPRESAPTAAPAQKTAAAPERPRGTEWREKVRTPEDDALGRY